MESMLSPDDQLDRRQLGHLMTAEFGILTTQGLPASAFGRLTSR
ncbi:MAG: hypothetical protein U0835_22345 [Isosphaeraceae bacterium]